MGFYEELSKVYEYVFPIKKNAVSLLEKYFTNGDLILDMGCGNGAYSIELGKAGGKVFAVDSDESMIEKAKIKGEELDLSCTFLKEDMCKVGELFKQHKFKLAFCIGNSLVHLKSKEDIESLIKDVYDLLEERGTFIIQIINYDRIVDYNITALPTIENKNIEFVRNYNLRLKDEKVDFNTKLILKDKNQIFENSISLIILGSHDLKIMLEGAGFKDVEFYGGFNNEEFTAECIPLVVIAKK